MRQAIHNSNVKQIPVLFGPEGDKKEEKKPAKQPDKKKPPVVITGFGSRIIITSDDPEALDLAQQIIRILINTEAGPGDFEVIRLQYANAVEVAKLLDEAYNGPKTNQQGGNRGAGAPGGFPGMLGQVIGIGGGGTTREEKIRVVADPTTNALLVRAKPIDMLTIRRLIATTLRRSLMRSSPTRPGIWWSRRSTVASLAARIFCSCPT